MECADRTFQPFGLQSHRRNFSSLAQHRVGTRVAFTRQVQHLNKLILIAAASAMALVATPFGDADARDWYVSIKRGKGKVGTKAQPAKELAFIIPKLAAGDVVHMASGVYMGKGDNGHHVITVPVSIIGGYSDDFGSRDPWGRYRTVLSGDNTSKNYKLNAALFIDLMKVKPRDGYPGKIVVDGLILDHGGRNRYKTDKNWQIIRKADPRTGKNPTPEIGALVISAAKNGMFDKTPWHITVQNNIVMNSAPTMGAMTVSGYKKSRVAIQNNLIINNTGTGIYVGSKWAGGVNAKDGPRFTITNNTVMFTWKHDPIVQSFSGNAIDFDASVRASVQNNVFAFADRHIVYNPRKNKVLLKNNIMTGNVDTAYLEFDTKIELADMEDEADFLDEGSSNNRAVRVKVPINADWMKLYGSRVLVDRNKAEANISASNTRANELRGMLGINLRAGKVDFPQSPVWLPRLSINEAVKAGARRYSGVGCQKP